MSNHLRIFYRLYRETRRKSYPLLKECFDNRQKLNSASYSEIIDLVNSNTNHFHLLLKTTRPESHIESADKPNMYNYSRELNLIKRKAKIFRIPFASRIFTKFPLPSQWFLQKEFNDNTEREHIKYGKKSLSKLVSSSSPNSIYKAYPSLSDMTQEELMLIYCMLDLRFPSKGDGSPERHTQHMVTELCSYFYFLFSDDSELWDMSNEHKVCAEIDRGTDLKHYFDAKEISLKYFGVTDEENINDQELEKIIPMHVFLSSVDQTSY